MNKTVFVITFFVGVFTSQAVKAQSAEVSTNSPWSVGFGLGPNLSQIDAVNDDLGSSIGTALWLSRDVDSRQRWDISLDYFAFKESGQYYLGLSGAYGIYFLKDTQIKPFGLIGLGVGQAKNFPRTVNRSQTTPHLFLRLGADHIFNLGQWSFGIIADFMHVDLDDKPATSAQLGLPMLTASYNFGDSEEPKSQTQVIVPPPEPESAFAPPTEPQVLDTDGDGVADTDDQCPNTGLGLIVNSIGCEKTVVVKKNLRVEFETNKNIIKKNYISVVDEFAEFLQRSTDLNVDIEGHTDSQGSRAHNLRLSRARAKAVKQALIARGVDASRIRALGFGPDKPEATNKTVQGRKKNRRVIAVLKTR